MAAVESEGKQRPAERQLARLAEYTRWRRPRDACRLTICLQLVAGIRRERLRRIELFPRPAHHRCKSHCWILLVVLGALVCVCRARGGAMVVVRWRRTSIRPTQGARTTDPGWLNVATSGILQWQSVGDHGEPRWRGMPVTNLRGLARELAVGPARCGAGNRVGWGCRPIRFTAYRLPTDQGWQWLRLPTRARPPWRGSNSYRDGASGRPNTTAEHQGPDADAAKCGLDSRRVRPRTRAVRAQTMASSCGARLCGGDDDCFAPCERAGYLRVNFERGQWGCVSF